MARRARQESVPTTADPAERARELALRLLANSPKSARQLRDGLTERDVDPAMADAIVARYNEVGLLDDAALAATIVRTRHRERGQARRVIAQELRRKGFHEGDIEDALAQVGDQDEVNAGRELARKRRARLVSVPPEVQVRRIASMLARKGYAPAVAFALAREGDSADVWDNGEESHTSEE